MKKLTGMKKNFSSLENKKLKDLSSINGGLFNGGGDVTNRSAPSNAGGATDTDYYKDDSDNPGQWKWHHRFIVG